MAHGRALALISASLLASVAFASPADVTRFVTDDHIVVRDPGAIRGLSIVRGAPGDVPGVAWGGYVRDQNVTGWG
jgi:hypothetical protein